MRQTARGLIVTKEQKICLMKRFKKGELYYTVLGGGVEDNETLIEALHRELIEEAGVIIDPSSIQPVDCFMFGTQEDHFFICEEASRTEITGEEYNKSTPENSYELVELTVEEFKAAPVRPAELKEKFIDAIVKIYGGTYAD